MELALSIILDELACYNPVTFKALSIKKTFKNISYYNPKKVQTNASALYLVGTIFDEMDFCHNCPKHLMILGNEVPRFCLEDAETVILIPVDTSLEELMQTVFWIFIAYENWNQSMLLAIIHHESIANFLAIAAEKLTNPLVLFDNSLTAIATAGEFSESSAGTTWDNIDNSGYTLADFFTLKKQLDHSAQTSANTGEPYIFHSDIDKLHSYASSHIWINGKLYGNLGLVDINAPFSEGQISIIHHITENLKLYFENNDTYMHIAENSTNFIRHLIEGTLIDEKNSVYHLSRLNWKINDDYYLLNFTGPFDLNSPIESNNYVKRIKECFPLSLISVYENSILLIIRHLDYPIKTAIQKSRLNDLLNKNKMKCGISICFNDFLQLKQYYSQSSFAMKVCTHKVNTQLMFYENCYREHLIYLLGQSHDLKGLCHPQILALRNEGEESSRILIHCLYEFLINARNLSATAKAMDIHRNTLIYRINKLSKILAIDFSSLNFDQLLYLMFSCIIAESLQFSKV